ncbi:MAG: hypothetical protein K2P81_08590 [Bacteriovoracaceae bacterium]|nr:hypothetical protein [Bacteriovoracaceae bacterium]
MEIDSLLHVLLGGFITLLLFANGAKGAFVLFTLLALSSGKEFFDHFFYLGHSYPACMPEHTTDFFSSLIFFFLFLPILSFFQPEERKLLTKKSAATFVTLSLLHLAFHYYQGPKKIVDLLALNN